MATDWSIVYQNMDPAALLAAAEQRKENEHQLQAFLARCADFAEESGEVVLAVLLNVLADEPSEIAGLRSGDMDLVATAYRGAARDLALAASKALVHWNEDFL